MTDLDQDDLAARLYPTPPPAPVVRAPEGATLAQRMYPDMPGDRLPGRRVDDAAEAWRSVAKASPSLEADLADARRAVADHPELGRLLNATRLGDHPDVIARLAAHARRGGSQ